MFASNNQHDPAPDLPAHLFGPEAEAMWKKLNQLHDADPTSYRSFVETQMKELQHDQEERATKSKSTIVPKKGFVVKSFRLPKSVEGRNSSFRATNENENANQKKVFINFCSHAAIQPPMTENGMPIRGSFTTVPNSNESIHVPLVVSKLRSMKDAHGDIAYAVDVVVNPLCMTDEFLKFRRTDLIQLGLSSVEHDHERDTNIRLDGKNWKIIKSQYKGGTGLKGDNGNDGVHPFPIPRNGTDSDKQTDAGSERENKKDMAMSNNVMSDPSTLLHSIHAADNNDDSLGDQGEPLSIIHIPTGSTTSKHHRGKIGSSKGSVGALSHSLIEEIHSTTSNGEGTDISIKKYDPSLNRDCKSINSAGVVSRGEMMEVSTIHKNSGTSKDEEKKKLSQSSCTKPNASTSTEPKSEPPLALQMKGFLCKKEHQSHAPLYPQQNTGNKSKSCKSSISADGADSFMSKFKVVHLSEKMETDKSVTALGTNPASTKNQDNEVPNDLERIDSKLATVLEDCEKYDNVDMIHDLKATFDSLLCCEGTKPASSSSTNGIKTSISTVNTKVENANVMSEGVDFPTTAKVPAGAEYYPSSSLQLQPDVKQNQDESITLKVNLTDTQVTGIDDIIIETERKGQDGTISMSTKCGCHMVYSHLRLCTMPVSAKWKKKSQSIYLTF